MINDKTGEDDYYPFGLDIQGAFVTNPKNLYTYNKKELQQEFGQYDYGARFYDPVVARWNTIDPYAEKSRRFSAYNYTEDNPIRNIDIDGDTTIVAGPNGRGKNDNTILPVDPNSGLPSATGNEVDVTIYKGYYDTNVDANNPLEEHDIDAVAAQELNVILMFTGVGEVSEAAEGFEGLEGTDATAPTIIQNAASSTSETGDPFEITISSSKYPEAAGHAQDAIDNGVSNEGVIDRTGASARRAQTLKDTPTKPGVDRDEFPPAVIDNNGGGASVEHISPGDNRGAGGSIGQQIKTLPNGTKVIINVGP